MIDLGGKSEGGGWHTLLLPVNTSELFEKLKKAHLNKKMLS